MSRSSEAANKSLLFCLLFLVFIAHSYCLPAVAATICEMRAEKTEQFFLSGSGCTIQGRQRADVLRDGHPAMAVALLARPLGTVLAELIAGVKLENVISPKPSAEPQGHGSVGLRCLQSTAWSVLTCLDTSIRPKGTS